MRDDPLAILERQETTRLPWLVPIRRQRMAESPFAFFRGAAAVMAADLARQSHSGVLVQLCGDAHLMNFGFYGSPERSLLFDINDFDETHPGPYEWDVIRLATSLVLAARSLGLNNKQQQKVCRRSVRAYAKAMAEFAAMPQIPMWVSRLDLEQLLAESEGSNLQRHLKEVVAAARRRNSMQVVRKLCERDQHGRLVIRHDPPLVWRFALLEEQWHGHMAIETWIDIMRQSHLQTLRPEIRHLFSQFTLSDAALRAVGVGSVGTRCAIALFVGPHPDDVLVLQTKQADASVLAPYLNEPLPEALQPPEHQGQRVVQGQRLMQTASDVFLSWATNPDGQHFYMRTFRDWKGSVDISRLEASGLADYGMLCGWTLAKAHARSGDRRAISAHIGSSKTFAAAMHAQAVEHADKSERDHQRLCEAMGTSS
jgi:uncharacterized protein (DUF2252 family)